MALELNPKNAASVEVYWWSGDHRWSDPTTLQNLSLVPPTEIPDYAIRLRGQFRPLSAARPS